jgi:hypothetical protein
VLALLALSPPAAAKHYERVMDTLLLSQDPRVVSALQTVCPTVGINLKLFSEADDCIQFLARRKIYGVIMDHAVVRSTELVDALRRSSSNKNAVTISLISNYRGESSDAMFTLTKPVSPELVLRTFRAAQGTMFREYRRYFRHPLQVPVTITTVQNAERQAMSVNASEHGLAIQLVDAEPIAPSSLVGITFSLPGANNPIELKGKIVWSNQEAKAGLRCRGITARDRKEWEKWLAARPCFFPSSKGWKRTFL